MSENNKEFYDLLNSVATTETFNLTLTDEKDYTFKQLSTSQLKELIKTVVDSPLTQAVFSNATSKIIRESIVTENVDTSSFSVIDRLLFIIETRIQSISPEFTLVKEEEEQKVNLQEIKQKLVENLKSNISLFQDASVTNDQITISFGVPTIKVESQLNDELYKDSNVTVETQEELRKVLGETFVNEIAKSIKTIKIQDKELDLSTVTFKSRLKTIESLPASLVNSVITFIENYRKVIDDSLTIREGLSVTIDGSLFSLR